MVGTILDRSNRSKIQQGSGPPISTTRGNIYIDEVNHLFYFKYGSTWTTPASSVTSSLDSCYNEGQSITADENAVTITSPDGSNNQVLILEQNDISNNLPNLIISTSTASSSTISGLPIGGESIFFGGTNNSKVINSNKDIFIGSYFNIGESASFIRTSSTTKYNPFINIIAKKEHADTAVTTSTIVSIESINNSAGDGVINLTAVGSTYGSFAGYINSVADHITFLDSNLVGSNWTNPIRISSSVQNWNDAYALLGNTEGSLLDLILSSSGGTAVLVDGSRALTGDWSLGGHDLTGASSIYGNPSVYTPGSQIIYTIDAGIDYGDGILFSGSTFWDQANDIIAWVGAGDNGNAVMIGSDNSIYSQIRVSTDNLFLSNPDFQGSTLWASDEIRLADTVEEVNSLYALGTAGEKSLIGAILIAASGEGSTYTSGTGLYLDEYEFSLNHLGIEDLADPGVDQILFWDESSNTTTWLSVSGSLSISGTTLSGTDTNTTYDNGTGISLVGTTFALSHLGLQSLTGPGANRILFWDQSVTATAWLTVGSGLTISSTTITANEPALAQYAIGVGNSNSLLSGDTTKLQLNAGNQLLLGNGTPNRISTTADSAYVTGNLEVDGTADFDGITTTRNTLNCAGLVTFQSSLGGRFYDGAPLYFGTSNDASLTWRTPSTPDKLVLGLGSESNAIVICGQGDVTIDWSHALQTNPTLYIQSATTTVANYISFTHDQTDGVISSGAGAIKFNAASTILDANAHKINNLLSANFGSAPTGATFNTNTITVNWSTGKPIQTVTATANITTVTMTAPSGIQGLCLIITASGGDRTLAGFTGITWYGAYNPGTATFTIPSGSSAIVTLNYIGSSAYVGSLTLAKA